MEKELNYDALVEQLKASTSAEQAIGVLWVIKEYFCSLEATHTLVLIGRFLWQNQKLPDTEQIIQRFLHIRNLSSPNFYKITRMGNVGDVVLLRNNVNPNSDESFYAKDDAAALQYVRDNFGIISIKIMS